MDIYNRLKVLNPLTTIEVMRTDWQPAKVCRFLQKCSLTGCPILLKCSLTSYRVPNFLVVIIFVADILHFFIVPFFLKTLEKTAFFSSDTFKLWPAMKFPWDHIIQTGYWI